MSKNIKKILLRLSTVLLVMAIVVIIVAIIAENNFLPDDKNSAFEQKFLKQLEAGVVVPESLNNDFPVNHICLIHSYIKPGKFITRELGDAKFKIPEQSDKYILEKYWVMALISETRVNLYEIYAPNIPAPKDEDFGCYKAGEIELEWSKEDKKSRLNVVSKGG